ncbi:S1 RNA-binding domain-containing protein [Streptomyces tritici]|uniref:S1 RNA-binding domain-containing protein n=1 Tax=Streptomyces tritici TaxID=2054410 RepID=UPI003AF10CF9
MGMGSRSAAVELLRSCGAESVEHPGGTLLAHLERVESRLASWGARESLRLAGLCHAFYGTDGFAESLLPLDRRPVLREAIGPEAEALVHFYASCDRDFSYTGLTTPSGLFRDRFTGEEYAPTARQRADFAELTAANELDLLAVNVNFRREYRGPLHRLLTGWQPLLSEPAFAFAMGLLSMTVDERRAFLREGLRKGQVLTGRVSSIENFGVFVDIGGVDGMINVTELSWHHIRALTDVVQVGDEVAVEVLDIDLDRERIALSRKALLPDPYPELARTLQGRTVTGPVTKVVPFGVFVRVADGIEGLVHHDHLDGRRPSEGEELRVEVAEVDVVRRRVSLRAMR